MLLLVIVTALLCSSTIRAGGPSVSFFYPQGIAEASCRDTNSWTKWFNTAQPSSGNFDQELLTVIQGANGRDVCPMPLAMQAKSVGALPTGVTSYSCSWSLMGGNIIAGFKSNTADLDFEVRFCCPNNAFTPTTTTTTTARPFTSNTCGRAQIKNSLVSRIFGGSHAIPNSWPWQVLYEQRKPCGNNQVCSGLCGGTILDEYHILTAAHCIDSTDPSTITITAGLHNKNNNEANTRQVRAVARIYKHQEYDPTTTQNDLTILRLAQPLQFNAYVQPACLPGPEPQPDDDVVLIGWGLTQVGGSPYNELKQTKVKVVGDCSEKFWGPKVDDDKQVCVGNPSTGDSACQGDSGGPMLYQRNGQWVVAGVTSFGYTLSCQPGSQFMPNVYVRVSYYLPWIRSIVPTL